ncbi:MAG: type IV pilus modification protein PilV [Ramlibacter sp.]|nr:type IV pilus modification protein PilV [Ramlibacter sp.]
MKMPCVLQAQRGLSLVEVLVALVIFAFALLGAAGLQISTLKSNQFTTASATAASLAREYGELMQSYPSSSVSSSSVTSSFFIDTSTMGTATAASACNGASTTCDPSQLLGAEIRDWSERVKVALPGGRAEVCRDSDPRDSDGNLQWGNCNGDGDLVVVKVGWFAKSDKGEVLGNTRPRLVLPLMGNFKDYKAP